jgi:hypothetical protein
MFDFEAVDFHYSVDVHNIGLRGNKEHIFDWNIKSNFSSKMSCFPIWVPSLRNPVPKPEIRIHNPDPQLDKDSPASESTLKQCNPDPDTGQI